MSFETGNMNGVASERFHPNANEVYRLPSIDYLTPGRILKFVEKHTKEQVPRLKTLKEYYSNKTAIKYRGPRVDEERADNRISHNFARYISIVNQGYFLGKPITYNHNNEKLLKELNDFNDRNKEQAHNSNMALNLSIYGRAYELVYMDKNSQECLAKANPEQTFLIYDTTVEGDVIAGIRYFSIQIDDIVEQFIEVYDSTKCTLYKRNNNELLKQKENEHYFDGVPLIEYWNNDDRTGDFEDVMDQIDAYDSSQSDTLNGMDDFADSYLVLTGQPQTNQEDVKDMKKSRVIILDDPMSDGVKPNAFYLTKTYDVQGEEAFKNRTVNDIHKLSFTPDLTDEKFSGNVSGEAMKYKVFVLEQLRATKERLFKEALIIRLRLIAKMWSIKNKDNDIDNIEMVFTPNLPANVKEMIQNAKDSEGIVSEETQLAMHPMVEDVQAELERKRKEKEEKTKQFQLQPLFLKDGEGNEQ